MRKIVILIICSFFIGTSASAKRYTAPEGEQIYSENGKFFINIDPNYNRIEVFLSAAKNVLLWTLNKKIGFHRYFISNDGKRIFIIKEKFCKKNKLNAEAVSIYTENGLEKSFSYSQLSIPRKSRSDDNGPKGSHWRVWRNEDITIENDHIVISVIGKEKQIIDMTSGSIYLISS
ncbi:hypothetical protein ACFLQ1_00390 [Candidatus Auribacterota bacterium]